jgi:hypothetical protein
MFIVAQLVKKFTAFYGTRRFITMKMAVFWVVTQCSLVNIYRAIALMMEAARTSETSVNFYQITLRNNPEDGRLQPEISRLLQCL